MARIAFVAIELLCAPTSIRPIRSRLLAQARTYLCVDWVYERTSFGGNFVSSEQALARLYSRRVCFLRGFRLRQASFDAVCVRIGGLRLNFIRHRLALARFIRRVNANLARAMPALVCFVCACFIRTRRPLHASRRGFRRIL